MSKREFHYCEGKSQKFWSITTEACTHTVNYGRLGTAGQTQTKEFPTEDEAKKSCEKLIGEKLKKGYVEVAVESASPSQNAEVATKSEQSETKIQKPVIPATPTDTDTKLRSNVVDRGDKRDKGDKGDKGRANSL
jgi:predicted DNA-binding WGR domain protein